jgi:hypothetical protein
LDRRERKTSVGEHRLYLRNENIKFIEVDWATGTAARAT